MYCDVLCWRHFVVWQWMLQLWPDRASPCSQLKWTSSVNCHLGTLCSSSHAETVLQVMLTFQPRCTCHLQGLWFPLVHLGPIPGSDWTLTCHLTLFLLYNLQICQLVSRLIRKVQQFWSSIVVISLSNNNLLSFGCCIAWYDAAICVKVCRVYGLKLNFV